MTKKKLKKTETIKSDADMDRERPGLAPWSWHWPFENDAFAPIHSLRKEIDDIFNQFSDRFGTQRSQFGEFQIPALDVDETDDALSVSIEMPGVDEDDIEISLTENLLSVKAEKEKSSTSEKADHHISERSYSRYERSLRLPFQCDADAVSAEYEKGVLKLNIEKPAGIGTEPQKINIKKAA